MRELFSELKRRNVFRVAVAYLLVAWVLLEIADMLFPALSLPDWTVRLVAELLKLALGQYEEAVALQHKSLRADPLRLASHVNAKLHAYRGDADAAFEWLDKAYDTKDPLLGWIRRDSLLANVRDDPRFAALLRRMNLPE